MQTLLIAWIVAAWFTHVVVSISQAKWILLLVGAIFFPSTPDQNPVDIAAAPSPRASSSSPTSSSSTPPAASPSTKK